MSGMLLQEELEAAGKLCDSMLAGEGVPGWGCLMEPFPFFTAFANYLQARSQLWLTTLCFETEKSTHLLYLPLHTCQ